VNIGELVGYIKLDGSGVGQGIRDAQAQMKSGMDRLTNDAGAAGEKAGKTAGTRLSGAFGSAVKTIGAGLVAGLAVGKVIDYLRGTIDAASDLNETVNMSTVIFGRNQTAIEQWASKADRALGLSTEAAMRNAASFGDMFLQLGFAEDKALAMSTAVVQMSADLGSFKNLKTEDVLQRIAAGFRGEYDSLQLLIPNMSAARVEPVSFKHLTLPPIPLVSISVVALSLKKNTPILILLLRPLYHTQKTSTLHIILQTTHYRPVR